MAEFKGSIELISGITPKNGLDFPLVNAKDVLMPDGTRLSEFTGGGSVGSPGISITKTEINSDGELVLTYSNGNAVNVGKVVGSDGVTPHIGNNSNWWLGSSDTGVKAEGKDGITPHIGENKNWWIGSTDTGVKAEGKDGAVVSGGSGLPVVSEKDNGKVLKVVNGVWAAEAEEVWDGEDITVTIA